MKEHYDYDVIIIGAGIGGLVCGCYLAKAGLKTLIVEKNAYPGGYCCSFTRQGYRFDACAHALSSLKEGGLFDRLLNELGIRDRLKFNRYNPSEVIITPNLKINIFHEVDRTVEEFQRYFPQEKNQIEKFFKYIVSDSFLAMRRKTFEQLLNSFFNDPRLKTIFSIVNMQLLGVSSAQSSALVASLLWREFMFDGGYYPVGGMQALPDTLLERFTELRGDIILGKMVKKIRVGNNKIKGTILSEGRELFSKYIVSACDARQTFFEMIEQGNMPKETISKFDSRAVSSSGFLLYLGVDKDCRGKLDLVRNIYLITNYNEREVYSNFLNCVFDHLVIASSSGKDRSLNQHGNHSVFLGSNALYKNADYWNEQNRERIANKLIELAESVIPNLSKHILLRIAATPQTLYKWTKNYMGAAYGWASTPEQFADHNMSQKTDIENLYLTGHWSNKSSGITSVANCGRSTANLILKKETNKL